MSSPNASVTTGKGIQILTLAGAAQSTVFVQDGKDHWPREIHFWKAIDYTLISSRTGGAIALSLATDIATWPGVYVLTDGTITSIDGASGKVVLIY